MGKRVMIVDDSATFRMMLKRMLDATGFPIDGIVEAGDAEEGLRRIEEDEPDLILLDLNLPAGDGVDLVTAFKAKRDVTIVLVTADASLSRLGRALENGADGCLRKPFFPEKLKQELLPYFR